MNILLDECMDKRFARHLPQYAVKTVAQMGWRSLKNGHLLTQAQTQFDVFITVDQNVRHQQNMEKYDIAIIVLEVFRTSLPFLTPLLPQVEQRLLTIEPHQLIIISEVNQE